MAFDTFDEGVTLGGVRSKNEIRILICYLLNCVKENMDKELVVQAITIEELANYFEMSQALSELADNGNVIIKENELIITDKGKKNSETLEHDIPFTVREQAFNAAVRLQTRLRRERENKIRIDRVEKGCNVTISVVDADDEIMSVKLFVADYDQALAVKERFLEDPVRIYSNIVALLLA